MTEKTKYKYRETDGLDLLNPTDEDIANVGNETEPEVYGVEETEDVKYVKSDSLKTYLKDIGRYRLLTQEEEIECAKKILKGGKEGDKAREQMIVSNLRLVVNISKKFYNWGMPFQDVIAYGNFGLIKAIEKFDYTLGYKFSTYATWWIKQSISRAISDYLRPIRIPVHMGEIMNQVRRAKRVLLNLYEREPTEKEIANYLDINVSKVKECTRLSNDLISLETPVGESGDAKLADFIEDDTNESPEISAEKSQLSAEIDKALSNLTEKEANIIRLRFGFVGGEIKTLDEIGRMYGVTRERIRQIEAKALRKLKVSKNQAALRDFLYE